MDPLQTPSEPPVSTPPVPETPAPTPEPTPAPEAPVPPVGPEPAPATPPVAPTAAPAADSNTFSIVALILAFVFWPAGLIMGIVAFMKSKKAGQKNTLALVAIIIGGLALVGTVFAIIALMAAATSTGATITTY